MGQRYGGARWDVFQLAEPQSADRGSWGIYWWVDFSGCLMFDLMFLWFSCPSNTLYTHTYICISVRSRRCSGLVSWFCYHLIAKPGNKTGAPSCDLTHIHTSIYVYITEFSVLSQHHNKGIMLDLRQLLTVQLLENPISFCVAKLPDHGFLNAVGHQCGRGSDGISSSCGI